MEEDSTHPKVEEVGGGSHLSQKLCMRRCRYAIDLTRPYEIWSDLEDIFELAILGGCGNRLWPN